MVRRMAPTRKVLPELMRDFQDKVVQAAQKLQAQLANNPVVLATVVPSSGAQQFDTSGVTSVEQPVSSSSEPPNKSSVT